MTRLSALVADAALALAATAALAQGKASDAPKATPATPATPAAGAPGQAAKPATLGQPAKSIQSGKEFDDQVDQGRPDQDPDARRRSERRGERPDEVIPAPRGTLGAEILLGTRGRVRAAGRVIPRAAFRPSVRA